MTIEDIASDQLRGVRAIAEFRGETPRRTRYLIEKGELPVGREGITYVASKRRLRHAWEELTGVRREHDDDGEEE